MIKDIHIFQIPIGNHCSKLSGKGEDIHLIKHNLKMYQSTNLLSGLWDAFFEGQIKQCVFIKLLVSTLLLTLNADKSPVKFINLIS